MEDLCTSCLQPGYSEPGSHTESFVNIAQIPHTNRVTESCTAEQELTPNRAKKQNGPKNLQ